MESFNDEPTDRINRCDRFSRLAFFRGGRGRAQVGHQGKLICSQLLWIKKG